METTGRDGPKQVIVMRKDRIVERPFKPFPFYFVPDLMGHLVLNIQTVSVIINPI